MEVNFYVLVPVYRVERYISQCIESVLKQSYQKFCLILVDDGTPDQAGLICDAYAAKDPRIHVIHKENQGQLSARCAAIDCCREHLKDDNGFFVFLDSDDTLEQNALDMIAKTLAKNDCDVVIYGLERVFDGRRVGRQQRDLFDGTITDKRELYLKVFSDEKYNSLCRKAIKRPLMEGYDYTDYYHLRNGEDLLQSISVYKNCKKVVFIPEILYNYTENPDSVTRTSNYGNYDVCSTVRAKVWEFLQSENVYTESDKQAYLRHCRQLLIRNIYVIGQFDTSYSNIRQEFVGVHNDAYFSMLINTDVDKQILLRLVGAEKYRALYLICRCRKIASGLRRRFKNYNG